MNMTKWENNYQVDWYPDEAGNYNQLPRPTREEALEILDELEKELNGCEMFEDDHEVGLCSCPLIQAMSTLQKYLQNKITSRQRARQAFIHIYNDCDDCDLFLDDPSVGIYAGILPDLMESLQHYLSD